VASWDKILHSMVLEKSTAPTMKVEGRTSSILKIQATHSILPRFHGVTSQKSILKSTHIPEDCTTQDTDATWTVVSVTA
jgi:hypothetical protein